MFGKILVCLHLVLSLCLATWALVLFTNRVDWGDKKGQAAKPDGLTYTRKNDYTTQASGNTRPADDRWRSARKQLEDLEEARPRDREWFELQLKFLNTVATEANPVRQVDRGPDGNPVVVANPKAGEDRLQMGQVKDAAGNPLKGPDGQALVLKSLGYYNEQYDTALKEETAALARRLAAAERDKEATKKLTGRGGLQARLTFETIKQDRLKDEHSEIRPLWLNTMVEYKNLAELRQRLAERLRELESLKSKGDKEGR